jgi:tRNA (mo5U34)-methyltransferase
MINCRDDFNKFKQYDLEQWLPKLQQGLAERIQDHRHGELEQWLKLLNSLPTVAAPKIELKDRVSIGTVADLTTTQQTQLKQQLQTLHPWRKGPFELFGQKIDCEWRSDWKWQRLINEISPLQNRRVLDIGCGNGFHLWKILGEGARCAIGIDPSQLFWAQFQVFKHYLPDYPAHLIPVGIECLPNEVSQQGFDSIFCMGVLYHRRSPIETLIHLRKMLRTKGELILETLVIDGDENQVLVPRDRYAQMRNVWFLPSVAALTLWFKRSGFNNIKVVNVETTTTEEQRSTEWMKYHSLQQFLDPNDANKTIEGYPAPTRAIITATPN